MSRIGFETLVLVLGVLAVPAICAAQRETNDDGGFAIAAEAGMAHIVANRNDLSSLSFAGNGPSATIGVDHTGRALQRLSISFNSASLSHARIKDASEHLQNFEMQYRYLIPWLGSETTPFQFAAGGLFQAIVGRTRFAGFVNQPDEILAAGGVGIALAAGGRFSGFSLRDEIGIPFFSLAKHQGTPAASQWQSLFFTGPDKHWFRFSNEIRLSHELGNNGMITVLFMLRYSELLTAVHERALIAAPRLAYTFIL